MNRGGGRGKKKFRDKSDRFNQQEDESSKLLKLSEFVSVSDLASLMDVSVNEVIGMSYNLLNKTYSLGPDTSVNYLVAARKDG